MSRNTNGSISLFLSTPSARRATRDCGQNQQGHRISIHALREEGDQSTQAVSSVVLISIHALREEGDRFFHRGKAHQRRFLSTPSARRATSFVSYTLFSRSISIHATVTYTHLTLPTTSRV